VQETFLRAFIGLRGFRGEASLRTWLTRILLNEGRRRRRRQRATIELAALEAEQKQEKMQNSSFPVLVADGDPERAAARSEIGRRLEREIDDLPVAFRVVLILRDVEGVSIQQTAKLLGIRQETVKTRLHRARRRLRGILGEQFAAALKDVFPFERSRCDALVSRLQNQVDATQPHRVSRAAMRTVAIRR
jgi:RNA polymerase sigma-70 factor (ECF subfamily)